VRSQVRFFMHPDDELEFLRVAGPPFTVDPAASPITHLRGVASSTDDAGRIQFWRSQLVGSVLTDGRIALATSGFNLESRLPHALVEESEALYRRLRRHVRRHFANSVVRWWNPSLPPGPTNPTSLDQAMWVGPAAMAWWTSDPDHRLKSSINGLVEVLPPSRGAAEQGIGADERRHA
jgi:hypothetical protein